MYVDIAGRSSAMGHQRRVGWWKQSIFEQNAIRYDTIR